MSDKEPKTLKQKIGKAATDATAEAREHAAMGKALRHLRRHLPNILGVEPGYFFSHEFGTRFGDEARVPTLRLKLGGDYCSKDKYMSAVANVIRALGLKTMLRNFTGGYGTERPHWYYAATADIGGQRWKVELDLCHIVPHGCELIRVQERRTVQRHTEYRASCGRR